MGLGLGLGLGLGFGFGFGFGLGLGLGLGLARELDQCAEGGGHRPRRHQPLRKHGVAQHQPAAVEARGDDRGVGRVGGVLAQLVAPLLPLAQRAEQPVHVQLLAVGERLG